MVETRRADASKIDSVTRVCAQLRNPDGHVTSDFTEGQHHRSHWLAPTCFVDENCDKCPVYRYRPVIHVGMRERVCVWSQEDAA
jgi:hypothetical protein